jgi:hypothetical protein
VEKSQEMFEKSEKLFADLDDDAKTTEQELLDQRDLLKKCLASHNSS